MAIETCRWTKRRGGSTPTGLLMFLLLIILDVHRAIEVRRATESVCGRSCMYPHFLGCLHWADHSRQWHSSAASARSDTSALKQCRSYGRASLFVLFLLLLLLYICSTLPDAEGTAMAITLSSLFFFANKQGDRKYIVLWRSYDELSTDCVAVQQQHPSVLEFRFCHCFSNGQQPLHLYGSTSSSPINSEWIDICTCSYHYFITLGYRYAVTVKKDLLYFPVRTVVNLEIPRSK